MLNLGVDNKDYNILREACDNRAIGQTIPAISRVLILIIHDIERREANEIEVQ